MVFRGGSGGVPLQISNEIYHRSQTKEQNRTSRVAWKPKKIHAKPGEIGVESRQRCVRELLRGDHS